MRSVGSEILFSMPAMVLPLALVFVFPREALDFRGVEEKRAQPSVLNFVSISAVDEANAVKAAKTIWKSGEKPLMAIGTLPEEPFTQILDIGGRTFRSVEIRESYGRSPYLPSLAAPPPAMPAGTGEDAQPTFSRKELLQLN